MAIIGATGSGKTSACLHPYLEQLFAHRAHDPARKVGGLFLEVKGDFCSCVREILTKHGRDADYVEVSRAALYRYNPLPNALEAYALAYGTATLMTNLVGRGKERFAAREPRTAIDKGAHLLTPEFRGGRGSRKRAVRRPGRVVKGPRRPPEGGRVTCRTYDA